ncbi:hypothetical protein [uncultured Sunxiuqinia sp.]|uniref:tetratricopeptide repeat protein n=1 Tax=uncultured Sunxiuqinia sp. TaxID=1573825 RepID=UPI002AA94EFB|nr:hypothetical protein [uncultured Sunxiuqinia sp.]
MKIGFSMQKIGLLILGLVLFVGLTSCAQTSLEKARCQLKKTYIEGDMENWEQHIQKMEKESDGSLEWQLEILMARYGLIGYYLGNDKKESAKEILDTAEDMLDQSIAKFPDSPKLYCIQTAFYGFRIAFSIFNAPLFLPKLQKSLKMAEDLNSNEPFLWLEKGNLLFNRPKAFGGDKVQAIEDYEKALDLFQDDEMADCSWIPVLLQALIVKAYYQTEQTEAYQASRQQLEKKYGRMTWLDYFVSTSIMD